MQETDPKFTPGQWFIDDEYRVLADDARRTIIHVPPCSWTNAEAQTDSKLFAASKELYEALDRIVKWLPNVAGDTSDNERAEEELESLEIARAALRKARGEP